MQKHENVCARIGNLGKCEKNYLEQKYDRSLTFDTYVSRLYKKEGKKLSVFAQFYEFKSKTSTVKSTHSISVRIVSFNLNVPL